VSGSSTIAGRGWFISFEGSEGCGKSTQIGLLGAVLEQRGLALKHLREPGGTPLGEEIRHLLKHSAAGEAMCAEAELFLFAASRAELSRKVIGPWLEKPGRILLADRFFDSTTVYQGLARGLDLATVRAVNALATGGIVPDLTILLDLSVDESRRRTARRGEGGDRIEREADAFFARVRDGYLAIAAAAPERFLVLNGAEPAADLHRQILQALPDRLHGFHS
jgi:dTMP kinase